MNDQLLKHFLELQKALSDKGVSIILGGGMSLYINLTYRVNDDSRYPFNIAVRPTNDLDIFLTADLITDALKYETIKSCLEQTLGYKVVDAAKWFQFEKEIELYGGRQKIKVDLLTAPPRESDLDKVSIKAHRVKPKSAEGIHAYLTKEAKGLEIGIQTISLPDNLGTVTIVSNFNYLIFKLHAFADRVQDSSADYGRHHALDIFYTVARMGEGDWDNARDHAKQHAQEAYLINAQKIQRELFNDPQQLGLIRMAENQVYKANFDEFSRLIQQFLVDIRELFKTHSN